MDGKEVDFERLDDSKIQEQFVKTMSDMYISKAKAHFSISKDLDDLEKEILMQAYSGVTRQQLQHTVGKYGKDSPTSSLMGSRAASRMLSAKGFMRQPADT